MSEVSAPISAPTAAPARMTSSQAFAALSNQPSVSTPTAPPTPKPEPVQDAIRVEQTGSGATTDASTEAASSDTELGTQQAEQLEEQLSADPIDYQQKLAEILDSGDLHQSLMDKMLIAKIDGQEVPVSVKEALAGYMRRSNHSKAMNELQAQQSAMQAEKAQFDNMWSAFKAQPELALEIFGERYGDEWLDRVVSTRLKAREEYDNALLGAGHRAMVQYGIDPQVAAQDQRVLQAMQGEKQRLDRARQLEVENKKLRRAQEAAQAQQAQAQQQTQAQDYETQFNATVKRFSDAALKAEGLPVNSITRAELNTAVAQVLIAQNHGVPEGKRSYSVTQDVVREAAQILKETKGSKPAQAEQPLPPRQGMGTGAGVPIKQQTQRMTSSQAFEALSKKR